MNYEERYKEALDLMKDCVPDENGLVHVHPEDIFPELRESEDDRIRKGIIRNLQYLADRAEGFVKDELAERIAWLENQGTSYTKRDVDDAFIEGMAFAKDELEKQKPAWSEEDEGFLNLLLAIFKVEHPNGIFSTGNITVFNGNSVTSNRIIDWIKDLKDRVQTQPHWKPSEEQMKALHDMNLTGNISYAGQGQVLIELYNDLEKL